MAKQTFTTGQVLTAAQMSSLQQTAMGGGEATAKTASYVLTAADAGTTVIMNAAGATTITVNTALFAAGDTVNIQNIGAGTCTVTAGTATVNTAGSLALGQYEGGVLYFRSTSASTFFDYVQSGGTGGKTLLSTTALSGTSTTVSGISGSYTDLYVYVLAAPSVSATVSINFNSFAGWLGYYVRGGNSGTPGVSDTNSASNLNSINTFDNSAGGAIDAFVPQYATSGAGKYKMAQYNFLNSNGTTLSGVAWPSSGSPTAAITGVTVSSTQTLTGTILVYGIL